MDFLVEDSYHQHAYIKYIHACDMFFFSRLKGHIHICPYRKYDLFLCLVFIRFCPVLISPFSVNHWLSRSLIALLNLSKLGPKSSLIALCVNIFWFHILSSSKVAKYFKLHQLSHFFDLVLSNIHLRSSLLAPYVKIFWFHTLRSSKVGPACLFH